MAKKDFGTVDFSSAKQDFINELRKAKEELKSESDGITYEIGDSWDSGVDYSVRKIKASSIKLSGAFNKLTEKINKQKQQLVATLNGKDLRLNIDFSDIDINSDKVKSKVSGIVQDFSDRGLIEFDGRGTQKQFENLITLYVKYSEKLSALKSVEVFPTTDAQIKNLQEQFVLANKIKDIYSFLNSQTDYSIPIVGTGQDISNLQKILPELMKVQNTANKITGEIDFTSVTQSLNDLKYVIEDIKNILSPISDIFDAEKNAMSEMANNGVTSFTTLSQALVSVYDNLVKVQGAVDEISTKDFNITQQIVQKGNKVEEVSLIKQYRNASKQLYDQIYNGMLQDIANSANRLKGLNTGEYNVGGFIRTLMSFEKDVINPQDLNSSSLPKMQAVFEKLDAFKQNLVGFINLINSQDPTIFTKEYNKIEDPARIQERRARSQQQDVAARQPQTSQELNNLNKSTVDFSAEEASIEKLKVKLEEVKSAISAKNKAFIDEGQIVGKVIGKEVSALDVLLKRIDSVSDKLINLISGIRSNEGVSTAFDQLFNEIQISISEIGVTLASNLLNDTTSIISSISSLTKSEIDSVVEYETQKLQTLSSTLGGISEVLQGVKNETQPNAKSTSFEESNLKVDSSLIKSITLAIKEAIHAPSLESDFLKITNFEQIFEDTNFSSWINKFTGELFDDFESAYEDFSKNFKGKLMDSWGTFHTREEAINSNIEYISMGQKNLVGDRSPDIIQSINKTGYSIVDAINRQGDSISQTLSQGLKIIPSQDALDTLDDSKLINAFDIVSKTISDWCNNGGLFGPYSPKMFFEKLQTNPDFGLRFGSQFTDALKTLGMTSSDGQPTFKIASEGARNLGVAIAEALVIPTRRDGYDQVQELSPKLQQANELGASVPRIISAFNDGTKVFELQTRMMGENIASLRSNGDFLNATDEQIDRLIHTFEVLTQVDLFPDFVGDNILFDKDKGFSLVDLEPSKQFFMNNDIGSVDGKIDDFLENIIYHAVGDDKLKKNFVNRVYARAALPPEQRLVNASTIAAERAQAQTANKNIDQVEAKITPTMEEGAIARLVDENLSQTPATVKVVPVVDTTSLSVDNIDNIQKTTNAIAQEGEAAENTAVKKEKLAATNENVAKSASATANTVKDAADKIESEGEAVKNVSSQLEDIYSEVDKKTKVYDPDGNLKSLKLQTTEQKDKFFETKIDTFSFDADGNPIMGDTKIIEDMRRLREEEAKIEKKIDQAKAKVQTYLQRFNNKTANQGSEIEGYKELSELDIVSVDQIDQAIVLMDKLEAKYNEIVSNFRKGSSSLNPFVNAMNAIDDIDFTKQQLDLSYNELLSPSEELVKRYNELPGLIEKVKAADNIESRAKAYGELKVALNEINKQIRIESSQQKIDNSQKLAELNELYLQRQNAIENIIKLTKQVNDSKNEQSKQAAQKALDIEEQRLKTLNEEINAYGALVDQQKLATQDTRLVDKVRSNNIQSSVSSADLDGKAEFSNISQLQKDYYDNMTKATLATNESDEEFYLQKALETELLLVAAKEQAVLTQEQLMSLEQDETVLRDKLAEAEQKVSSKSAVKDEVERFKEISSLYSQYLKSQQGLHKADIDVSGKDTTATVANLEAESVQLKEKLLSLGVDVDAIDRSDVLTQEQKNKLLEIEEEHRRKINELTASAIDKEKTAQQKAEERQNKQNQNYGKSQYNSANNKFESLSAAYRASGIADSNDVDTIAKWQEYESAFKKLEELRKRFESDPDAAKDIGLKQEFQDAAYAATQAREPIAQILSDIEKLNNVEQISTPKVLNENELENVQASIKDYIDTISNGKATIKSWNDTGTEAYVTINKGKGVLEEVTVALQKGSNQLVAYKTSTKEIGTAWERALTGVKKKFKEISFYLIGGQGIYKLVSMIKQGITYVKDIDTALTELKKVTDETDESYSRFLKDMGKTGAEVGATVQNLTNMAASWARLGYSMEQAGELAKTTAVLLNVSEFSSAEEASEALISTIQAYGYAAEDSMHVVDILNEIGNNFAISSDGLAVALQDSASSLMAAGNSLEQSVAMVAAANKVLQDPNSVGAALRTISLRIRGTSTKQLEELGEDTTGVVASKSKLRDKVKGLTGGVDILTDTGAYKDTYTVIKEIGQVWEDMNDIDRAALLELLAGKNRSNAMAALLTNMEDLSDAYDMAMDAEGSAIRENEKYLDSIQGRIDLFKNAIQTLWMNLISSDAVKIFVNIGTQGVKFLDTWYGKIIAILAVVDNFAGKKLPELFKQGFGIISGSIKNQLDDVQNAFWDALNIKDSKNLKFLDVIKSALRGGEGIILDAKFSDKIDVSPIKKAILDSGVENELKSKMQEALFTQDSLGNESFVNSIQGIDDLEAKLQELGVAEETANAIVTKAFLANNEAIIGNTSVLELSTAEKLKNAMATNLSADANIEEASSGIILTDANGAVIMSNEALTVSELQAALAAKGFSDAEIQAILSDAGLVAANETVAASFVTVKGAIIAAGKALLKSPLFWITIIAAAVGGLIALFDNLITTNDEWKDKLAETSDEIADIRSEIESLNSELKTTQDRIHELENKGPLSFTEEEELARLKRQNDELQRQIDLEKESEKRVSKKAAEQLQNTFDSDDDIQLKEITYFDPQGKPLVSPTEAEEIDDNGNVVLKDGYTKKEANSIDTSIGYLVSAKNEMDAAYQTLMSISDPNSDEWDEANQAYQEAKEQYETEREIIGEKIDDYNEIVNKEGVEWQVAESGEELEDWQIQMNETIQAYNDAIDALNIAMDGKDAKANTLNRIFGDNAFDSIDGVRDQIQNFINTTDDVDETQLLAYIEDLISQCPELAEELDVVGLGAKDVADYFLHIGDAVNETAKSNPKSIMEDLASTLGSIQSKYDSVTKAIDEFNQYGAISGETLSTLIDNDLLQYLTLTEDGMIANTNGLQAMEEAAINEAMAALNAAMVQDMYNFAMGKTSEMSTLAQGAVAGAGEAAATAGANASNGAVGFYDLAGAISAAKAAAADNGETFDPSKYTAGLNDIYKAYQGYANMVKKSSGIKVSAGGGGGSGGSSSSNEFNFIDVYFDNLENKIDERTAKIATLLDDASQIDVKHKLSDEILKYYRQEAASSEKVAEYYSKKANDTLAKIPKTYQDAIKNGSLDISKITDSSLNDLLSKYRDYVDKASEYTQKYWDTIEAVADAAKEHFDDVQSDYDNRISFTDMFNEQIQNEISKAEESGETISEAYYQSMIDNNKTKLELLQQQQKDLLEILQSGDVREGTDQYYEMVQALNSVDSAIDDCEQETIEWTNAINDIKMTQFEKITDEISRINDELSNMYDLVTADEHYTDDLGNWSKEGITALGILIHQMQNAQYAADQVAQQIASLDPKDFSSYELYEETLQSLKDKQWDYIQQSEDARKSIIDLNRTRIDAVKDGMQKELDAYKELIDKKKELLDADKNLYDFEKSLNEQNKNIADIERKLASLAGDSSMEAEAKRRKLQAELAEANADKEGLLRDKNFDDISDAYDNEVDAADEKYKTMEEQFETYLDDVEHLIQESFANVMANADVVLTTLNTTADQHGIMLSNALTSPWQAAATEAATFKELAGANIESLINEDGVITIFNLDGTSLLTSTFKSGEDAANQFKDTVNAGLDNIKAGFKTAYEEAVKYNNNIIDACNKAIEAYKKVQQQATTPAPTITTQGLKDQTTTGGNNTGGNYTNIKPPKKTMHDVYSLRGAASFTLSENSKDNIQTIDGTKYYYDSAHDWYYLFSKGKLTSSSSRHATYQFPANTTCYKYYAKGTTGVSKDQIANIDELGEELVVNVKNGRLQYLSKGTGVIPADLTKNLMDWGELDPTEVLNRSRPTISAPHITNNNITLDMNFGTMVNIEHADSDSLEDIQKAVQTQLDRYMSKVNNSLKRFTR